MSKVGDALEALRVRLGTVKTAAGYSKSLKTVRLNESFSTLVASEDELPLVEIIDEGEITEGMASATYKSTVNVILYLVYPKETTDLVIQDSMRDIRKAIFGGTSDATGNTGMTLNHTVTGVRYRGYQGDLNMLPSNRIYLMRFELWMNKLTYQD